MYKTDPNEVAADKIRKRWQEAHQIDPTVQMQLDALKPRIAVLEAKLERWTQKLSSIGQIENDPLSFQRSLEQDRLNLALLQKLQAQKAGLESPPPSNVNAQVAPKPGFTTINGGSLTQRTLSPSSPTE